MVDFLTKELLKDLIETKNLSLSNKTEKDNILIHEESNPEVYNKNIPGWNFNDYLNHFINYCVNQGMNINPLPELKIIDNDLENANKILGLTGYYNPALKEITLFTLNRHPKDILRTYAHELVHHEQNLEGKLGNESTTNTNIDPKLSMIEDEAYLKGSRIFRHWEDELKEKNT